MVSPVPQLLGNGLVLRSRNMLIVSDHFTVDSPSISLGHSLVVPNSHPETELGCPTVLQNCAEGKKY